MARKFLGYILFVAFCVSAQAQQVRVSGKVTYLSAGTVYASIGWEKGVQDSTILFVIAGVDTTALLKVLAVSSNSCACRIIVSSGDIVVGNAVVGWVTRKEQADIHVAQKRDSTDVEDPTRGLMPVATVLHQQPGSLLQIQGRMGVQYYASTFESAGYNFSQPGLVLDLRATLPHSPLSVDFYGNLRTLTRGSVSPFSRGAVNASRIYAFSLNYDDRMNDIRIGRIIPLYAPSIGAIDGISYARRTGEFTEGIAMGFQPSYDLQGVNPDTRKVALFGQYQMHGTFDFAVTGAYARTYLRSLLDREVVSFTANGYTAGGISVYGYGDVDLRIKQGDQFKLSPAISLASVNVSYQFTDFLTVGIGADAARSVFPFSAVQYVPDTLLDRTLRSGATVTVNISLMDGVGIFNTYSPRSTDGAFGSDYLNNSMFFISNVLSTGATVRAMYTLNENQITNTRGFGMNLERNVFGVDVTVRYQQNQYRILQMNQGNRGETIGADVMALLTQHLSFMVSLDSSRGFGPGSLTLFSELTWRF